MTTKAFEGANNGNVKDLGKINSSYNSAAYIETASQITKNSKVYS